MIYARTFEGRIQAGTFGDLWPNSSVGDQLAFALENGFSPVVSDLPHNPLTEVLASGPVYALDDFFCNVVVELRTPEDCILLLAILRVSLKERATGKRWSVETGGITLPNGTMVKTGRVDQDRITGTIAGMAAVGMESVDFKAESGWVTLTLADVRSIRAAIALHVQACFSAERAHHEAIDALADVDLTSYDVLSDWPA